ncbi:hypothetical protein ORI89_15340 [Sphingobacterium sp. UT-1RO-CII-1]|uniref:hypothetical protein n=1 Tax=Sphingobacterium sp. UT-1RO-CII-1 TaxID=2995225 RepID=UPI00227C6522|nr:hypothetical protein [Sphingobacterium sp. UT-1RO-CII-1]MCY4781033.1 hypothetical protein [Sphingobacterium sp. UT-1RO-CII-1]
MIRPLEYCENTTHIDTSLDTIDRRIKDLIILKEEYLKKKIILANKKEGVDHKNTLNIVLKKDKNDK